MKILILIPCYNEELNIDYVIENIHKSPLNDDYNVDIDYIIINDASKDNTVKHCREKGYNYLDLPINLGIGGCVQAGYKYACQHDYDIVIQHDGDGQHDSFYFLDAIAPILTEKADIVIGSRFIKKAGFKSTRSRRLGISFLSGIIHLCSGNKIYDVTSGYRAVNKKYVEFFAKHYAQDYPEPESIIEAIRNGANIAEIPVIMHRRKDGKSSISAVKSIYYMIKVTLSIILYRIIVSRGGQG